MSPTLFESNRLFLKFINLVKKASMTICKYKSIMYLVQINYAKNCCTYVIVNCLIKVISYVCMWKSNKCAL